MDTDGQNLNKKSKKQRELDSARELFSLSPPSTYNANEFRKLFISWYWHSPMWEAVQDAPCRTFDLGKPFQCLHTKTIFRVKRRTDL